MSESGRQFLKSLLFEASQLPASQRRAFLLSRASGDLLAEAERLLAALDSAGDLIATPWLSEIEELEAEILPKIGDIIDGRYRLERHLADGGSARVFLAADLRLCQNSVVLKVIRHTSAGTERWREVMANEIRTLARIQHPSVAGLVDAAQLPSGLPYLVTRYVSGGSLRELVSSGPLRRAQALKILETIAGVLDQVHKAGVLHLDLKPENIIVEHVDEPHPAVTVVDFGIAQTRSSAGSLSLGITPDYAAPEVLDGKGVPASDIYSLARIASEILPPHSARQRQVLQAALNPAAGDRPSSALALVGELSRGERAPHWPIVAAIALVAIAVFSSLFGIALSRVPTRPSPTILPLTSLKGIEADPAFSPHGDFLVFSFEAPPEIAGIWRLDLASAKATQLTHGAFVDRIPQVTADGRSILFYRRITGQPIELMSMPAAGGPAVAIHSGDVQSFCVGSQPNILYLSQWDSLHRFTSLYRLDVNSRTLLPLPSPPFSSGGDFDVACAPNGRAVAFARFQSLVGGDLFVQDLDDSGLPFGAVRQLTHFNARFNGIAWTPDSRQIFFASGSLTRATLWKTLADGSVAATQVLSTGEPIEAPSIPRLSWRLAAIRMREDSDIWRATLSAPGGELLSFEPVSKSSDLDEEGIFSPVDPRIAFMSERTQSLQAWVSAGFDSDPAPLTSFRHAEKAWLQWTTAGHLLLYAVLPDTGAAVYRLSPDGSAGPRRLFAPTPRERVVGISNDGQAIYLNCFDSKPPTLQRRFLDGRPTENIGEGMFGFLKEDPSSNLLYFTRSQQKLALWVMPHSGGAPSRVIPELQRRNSFALAAGWVYYITSKPESALWAKSLSSGQIRRIRSLDRLPGWGLSASANGKELLLALYDVHDSDLVQIENFR